MSKTSVDAANAAPRCTAMRRDGKPCKQAAMSGVPVCQVHGGSLPSVRAKHERYVEERKQAEIAMRHEQKSPLEPVSPDDPEVRGDIALATEIRRTIAWIRFCEAQLAARGVATATEMDTTGLGEILGGLQTVSVERTSGMERGDETSLVTRREAAGINVWEEKLRWNRTHLAGLTKQWINAGFEAKRLEIAQRTMDRLERAIDGIIRDAGLNPRDAEIRASVTRRLREAGDTEPTS